MEVASRAATLLWVSSWSGRFVHDIGDPNVIQRTVMPSRRKKKIWLFIARKGG